MPSGKPWPSLDDGTASYCLFDVAGKQRFYNRDTAQLCPLELEGGLKPFTTDEGVTLAVVISAEHSQTQPIRFLNFDSNSLVEGYEYESVRSMHYDEGGQLQYIRAQVGNGIDIINAKTFDRSKEPKGAASIYKATPSDARFVDHDLLVKLTDPDTKEISVYSAKNESSQHIDLKATIAPGIVKTKNGRLLCCGINADNQVCFFDLKKEEMIAFPFTTNMKDSVRSSDSFDRNFVSCSVTKCGEMGDVYFIGKHQGHSSFTIINLDTLMDRLAEGVSAQ